MFELSSAELLLVIVVAVVVIGPKDLPVVARTIGRWMRKAKQLGGEFTKLLEEAGEGTGIKEARQAIEWETNKVTRLIDLDGKEQRAYDVADIEKTLGVRMKPAVKKKPKVKTHTRKKKARG